MKRTLSFFLISALSIVFSACGQAPVEEPADKSGPTWQEQYDLGVRYLSEGNYEEAIIAFTAVIEIDPKQVPAYVGRGDAYIGSGETVENLAAAQADYEMAIKLDETDSEAYLKLADVYIQQRDVEKALELFQRGLDKTGNPRFQEQLDLLGQQTMGLSENASDPVTAVGYIILNADEYSDVWYRYMDQYQSREENIYCAIRPYGIRFENSVNATFNDAVQSIREAMAGNVTDVFDESTELYSYERQTNGTMIGYRMEMTGYFCPLEEPGELIGPGLQETEGLYYMYQPNGDYAFYIQSYTLLD